MTVYKLDNENAGNVARLMHRIKPEWWPAVEDAYGQLTDIDVTIRTVGWYLGEDPDTLKGCILCQELAGCRALELECSGFDDNGEFKLGELFRVAEAYARDKGYPTFWSGISSVGFHIHGKEIEDIPAAISSLKSERIDYKWYLEQGFQVISIQPNPGFHRIMLGKALL